MNDLRYPTKLEWIIFLIAVVIAFLIAIYFGDAAAKNLQLVAGCLAAIFTAYQFFKK